MKNEKTRIQRFNEISFGFVCTICTLGMAYGFKINKPEISLFSIIVLSGLLIGTREINNRKEEKAEEESTEVIEEDHSFFKRIKKKEEVDE